MIKIELLQQHQEAIPKLAQIWHEVLGQIWLPDISIERVEQRFTEHLHTENLPLTYVAFVDSKPVGMCSLRENDGIRADLKPWLGSLVVEPAYQGRGIAKLLIEATKEQARALGFEKLFLFAFDPTIPDYYGKQGWTKIAVDSFRDYPVTVMEIELF
ncbi:acetyltransferase [Legionella massiliensis]|uniref:Acetyltransferase n=1 Tax=Legionella massiliensis TaxID=1034943 RepID=A0A078L0N9_9GAMM|nr:GNAT family N-acetyltransferase [Legionella massiliensis]CDZ77614.1 acetyltransferase [Legionella massiliensis]CEE13352.1 acetyltransferase [Legionella massiliensis]